MPARITWKGYPETIARLKRAQEQMPEIMARAMSLEANIEMTESKKRCPVSPTKAQFKAMGRTMPKGVVPGTLRASGTVHQPEINNGVMSVLLTYGGAAKAYAIVQHERADFHHTTGQWKYLESVLNESRSYMAARIAKRVDVSMLKVR